MFEQYSQIIRNRYPDLNIIGENYTPSAIRSMTAQFLGTFKLVLIGLILFGQNPFTYLNMNTPNIFTWATENKVKNLTPQPPMPLNNSMIPLLSQ